MIRSMEIILDREVSPEELTKVIEESWPKGSPAYEAAMEWIRATQQEGKP